MSNDVLEKRSCIGDKCIDYVDSGRFYRQPVKILYYLFSIVTFGIPIARLVDRIDWWEYMGAKFIVMDVLLIIVGVFVAGCSFYLWAKRAKSLNLEASANSRFVAIPILANILQTIGEWLFIIIGIGGVLYAVISLLFGMINDVTLIVATPIAGYLICLFMRFLAESTKAIAHIANNTDAISKKLDK